MADARLKRTFIFAKCVYFPGQIHAIPTLDETIYTGNIALIQTHNINIHLHLIFY